MAVPPGGSESDDEASGEALAEVEPSEPRFSLADVYQNMVAAGLGEYFSLIFPNVDARAFASAVLGAAFIPAVAHIRQEWFNDRKRKGRLLVDSAAEAGNVTIDDLIQRASHSPKTRRLFMRALDAAAEAEEDWSVRTLGLALVEGLIASDDTVFDVSLKIVAAARDIGEAELCLLDFIVDYEPPQVVGDTGPKKLELPGYSHPWRIDAQWSTGNRAWTSRAAALSDLTGGRAGSAGGTAG